MSNPLNREIRKIMNNSTNIDKNNKTKNFGFYRVAAATPKLKLADIEFNTKEVMKYISEAERCNCATITFPELAITGYSCGDLFHNNMLIDKTFEALQKIAKFTENLNIIAIVGATVKLRQHLFNSAVVIHHGEIKGIVPKINLPNYREFYEKRWFDSGVNIDEIINIPNQETPAKISPYQVFRIDDNFQFGIEICEDMWAVIPPSSQLVLNGATMIFNPSASNELVTKDEYRKNLISQQSGRCICGYIYASSGVHESTTDVVYGGRSLIAVNGAITAKNKRFNQHGTVIYSDIDCQRLISSRMSESSFGISCRNNKSKNKFSIVDFNTNFVNYLNLKDHQDELEFCHISPKPFVPSDYEKRNDNCHEIFNIQKTALAKRVNHIRAKKLIIGISGGLDSTLALLVCVETFKSLYRDVNDIIAVTMPGFGTTDRTYNNAVSLCNELGVELREIDIKEPCNQHFKNIGHDVNVHDVTYENVQARERTKILMDLANKEQGILIGTGDLSEIALGWSTYNGDHMSMYAVNCSIPKTLIKYLIEWVVEMEEENIQDILRDVIDTPVSPELLPNSADAEINQKTEDIIGPYELHDFFLYHFVKYGADPQKMFMLAQHVFSEKYTSDRIIWTLKKFIWRFFSQQFKRSCMPDGPKVGTISLSPRGDWRMPSDCCYDLWINELEAIEQKLD